MLLMADVLPMSPPMNGLQGFGGDPDGPVAGAEWRGHRGRRRGDPEEEEGAHRGRGRRDEVQGTISVLDFKLFELVFGRMWLVGVRRLAAAWVTRVCCIPSKAVCIRRPPQLPLPLSSPVGQVVWSVLLLVEMVLSYLNLAANFPVLTVDVVQRVVDLFRVRWVL